jgi:hypothetical protein
MVLSISGKREKTLTPGQYWVDASSRVKLEKAITSHPVSLKNVGAGMHAKNSSTQGTRHNAQGECQVYIKGCAFSQN